MISLTARPAPAQLPTLTSLTLNPPSVVGGNNASATLILSAPAPYGGLKVALSSSNWPAVETPSIVNMPAGTSVRTFAIKTSSQAASLVVTISAAAGSTPLCADLTVCAPGLQSLTMPYTSLTGSKSITGTVTLSGPAPSSGLTVSLASSDASASVPATVIFPAGALSSSFVVTTAAVASATTAIITAAYDSVSIPVTLTVRPPVPSAIRLSPTSLTGGGTTTAVLTLTAPAPSPGITVSLSSSNLAAALPTAVMAPAGTQSITFAISTSAVTTDKIVVLSAQYAGFSVSAPLTVRAPVNVPVVTCTPAAVVGGSVATCLVRLPGPAPVGGVAVTLSSDTPAAAPVLASLTIPYQSTTVAFAVPTSPVSADTSVRLTASEGSASQSTVVTVLAAGAPLPTLIPVVAGARSIVAALDSLTSGGGGSSYLTYLEPRLYQIFGDGGPGYQGFDTAVAGFNGASFLSNGLHPMSSDSPTSAPATYAFFQYGAYTASGDGSAYLAWDPNRSWDQCQLFYLQLPGGGTFHFREAQASASSDLIVSTDGPFSLQSVTLTADHALGSQVQCTAITGTVALFGGNFTIDNGGIRITMTGRGGRTTAETASLDPTFQQAWWQALSPSLVLLNGGMNDRGYSPPATFRSSMQQVLNPIVGGSPATQILLIRPNDSFDSAITNLHTYGSVLQQLALSYGCYYVSNRDVLGSFANATASGWMFDVVHPNGAGNQVLSRNLLKFLGLHGTGPTADPDSFNTATSTPTISPNGANFSGSLSVTLADSTPGATIYYTTDTSIPNVNSHVYTGPITVTAFTVLKAMAMAPGDASSAVSRAVFYPILPTPTITPNGGSFSDSVTITLGESTPRAAIYYTTDGTTPTTSSPVYTGPFTLTQSATVQVMAAAPNYANSAVASASFTGP